jgi:DnaK suppressor protein
MKAQSKKSAVIAKVVTNKTKVAKAIDGVKIYSEKDLGQFRIVIMEKLDEAMQDNELLKNTLTRSNENGVEDTSPSFKAMEDGSDAEAKEESARLSLRLDKFIRNLQDALVRIENKTYGICNVTGTLIPKQRLLSVPHTTLCIGAKLKQQFN